MTLPVAKHAYDESWVHLAVGSFAIAVFVVAGLARMSAGLSTAIYLLVVTAAVTAFGTALLISDDGFSRGSPRRRMLRVPASMSPRPLSSVVSGAAEGGVGHDTEPRWN